MSVIEIFKKLCEIPHCSHHTTKMRAYLVKECQSLGFEVSEDAAGNILAHKKGSKITLQSHYDMVCIGQAPELVLEEDAGWLHAIDATLGADNGIGIAMTLALMHEGYELDALFTAEEEVGLLGARALALEIQTPYLLNIDSEDEGIVTIGCAGGVDISVKMPITREIKEVALKEVIAEGFVGGHSGVDIDKNIPNAIKVLADRLNQNSQIIEIKGGERRNSIAKYAKAICVDTKGSKLESVSFIKESAKIVSMLQKFEHGVRDFDTDLGIVKTSINLAMIESYENYVTLHLSARSMERQALLDVEKETRDYFKFFNCEVSSEGFYPPWQPERNVFANKVLEMSKKYFENASFGAIHAGLECGILKEKAPDVAMASIGPTIKYPHSNRECVEMASVEKVYALLKDILENQEY